MVGNPDAQGAVESSVLRTAISNALAGSVPPDALVTQQRQLLGPEGWFIMMPFMLIRVSPVFSTFGFYFLLQRQRQLQQEAGVN